MPQGIGEARWLWGLAERNLPLLGELVGADCCGVELLRLLELVSGLPGIRRGDTRSLYQALSELIESRELFRLLLGSWPLVRALGGEGYLRAPFLVSSITSTCLSAKQLWMGNDNGLVMLYELGDLPRLLAVYGLPGATVARLVCSGEAAAAVVEGLGARALLYIAGRRSRLAWLESVPALVPGEGALYAATRPANDAPGLVSVERLSRVDEGRLCARPLCKPYTTPSSRGLLYSGGALYLVDDGGLRGLVRLGGPPDYVDVSPRGRVAVLAGSTIRVYDANGNLMWKRRLHGGLTPRGIAWSPDGELLGVVMDEAVLVYTESGRRLYAAWHRYIEPAEPPGLIAWHGDVLVHATSDGVGLVAGAGGSFARLPLSLGASPVSILAARDTLVIATNRTVLITIEDKALNILDAGSPVHVAAGIERNRSEPRLALYPVTCPQQPAAGESTRAEPCVRLQAGRGPVLLRDTLRYMREGRPLEALAALAAYTSLAAPDQYLALVETNTLLEKLAKTTRA